MLIDELLTYLFDGQAHPLTQPMATWLITSRRFMAFVTANRDKIRKKVRVAPDPETVLDVRLELETAYILLQERSLSLVYEPQPLGQSRRPDFAVTYTTSLTFMVEVTRLRTDPTSIPTEATEQPVVTPPPHIVLGERLADTVCSKLGQLLPQRSNVLLVGVETQHLTSADLRSAMLRLQQRAERNDAMFWQRYRFRDRADFFRHYQRLSEILVRGPQLPSEEPSVIWVNPQAKQPLPGKVRTALYHSYTV